MYVKGRNDVVCYDISGRGATAAGEAAAR